MSKEKVCVVCGNRFIANNNSQKYCSDECSNKRKKENKKQYYEKNKNIILEKQQKKYNDNKDKIIERQKKYAERNKDKIVEYKKEYYKNNYEYYKKYRKEYYNKNKNIISTYNQEYYKNNKDKIKEYQEKYNKKYRKRYYKNKLKTDINYQMSQWCRNQIYRCINSNKNKHTFDILGYTSQDLREHLEKQFRDGMNWSNHGTLWHIDHIKPLCSFNFELPNGEVNYEEVKIANSLDNLQPLLIHENLSKGGKY